MQVRDPQDSALRALGHRHAHIRSVPEGLLRKPKWEKGEKMSKLAKLTTAAAKATTTATAATATTKPTTTTRKKKKPASKKAWERSYVYKYKRQNPRDGAFTAGKDVALIFMDKGDGTDLMVDAEDKKAVDKMVSGLKGKHPLLVLKKGVMPEMLMKYGFWRGLLRVGGEAERTIYVNSSGMILDLETRKIRLRHFQNINRIDMAFLMAMAADGIVRVYIKNYGFVVN
jgi:hypothetical protein